MCKHLPEILFSNDYNDQFLIAGKVFFSISTSRNFPEIVNYLYEYNTTVVYPVSKDNPLGVYGYTECESIHHKGLGVYFECISFTGSRDFSKHIVLTIHELLETYDYVVTTKHTENGPQEVIWEK